LITRPSCGSSKHRFGLPALTDRDANADPLLDLFDFSQARLLHPPALPEATIDADRQQQCTLEFPGGRSASTGRTPRTHTTMNDREDGPLPLTPGPLTTARATRAALLRDWGSRDRAFLECRAHFEPGSRLSDDFSTT
jgi:hypothetical protein